MRTLYFWHVVSSFLFSSSSFFFFSSPNLSRRTLDVYHTSTHGVALQCEFRMQVWNVCTWLAENTGCKKWPKIRYLSTIAQIGQAISSQLRHVSTIGKNKQQYILHMSSQYGELRPTNGWDRFGSFGHPSKFQRVSHLCSVTARHFSSGRQPHFAALNRGRHLYSAGGHHVGH